ncbi:MAG: hypothetical protein KKA73_03430 [Chloroflexi bacterium]|nr:hypothetical protein [Chloroflexota bacterium]
MEGLELHLFGTFQATLDGAPLAGLRSDKARALLAYLVMESGRSHRRETLQDLLWGEYPAESARTSLRSALHNLRQVLAPLAAEGAPPLLTITRQSVAWHPAHPACRVDVAEFDALVAATRAHLHQDLAHCPACVGRLARLVELYRGNLLTGLTLADSPDLDDWRLLQQETHHRQVMDALDALTAHHSALGRYEQVARYARRQIELTPWQETAHCQLMWALALSGQRGAALAQYETCRRALRQELGVAPAAETTALHQQIEAGALGWDAAAGGEPANPYKGLSPFQEADAPDFFGREALLARLLERLGEEHEAEAWTTRFLTVVGPSGSGKSSVVRAGLVPALRRAAQWSDEHWHVAVMFPGADPQAALDTALAEALLPPPLPAGGGGREAPGWGGGLAQRLPAGDCLLLVVDQAEELFTLTQDADVRARFIADLLAAAQVPGSRLHVVVTLRADYYAHPLESPDLGRLFTERVEFTLPLAPEELRRAIEEPARRAGVSVEPGLVDALVTDAGGASGALPLLQYALTELFEHREGRTMTLAAYQDMGGLAGALVGRVDALYAGLTPLEQAAARQLFLRLVVLDEESRVARRRVPRAEILSLAGQPWRESSSSVNNPGNISPPPYPSPSGGGDSRAGSPSRRSPLWVREREGGGGRERLPNGDAKPDLHPSRHPAGHDVPFASAQRQALETVLDLFGRHRLLTFDQDPATGAPTVEIAHEALIAAWDCLGDWIRASREDLRLRRRLRALTGEWERSGRDPSLLARGRQLDQLVDWVATADLAPVKSEYLHASLSAREAQQAQEAALERRARTRLRALVAVLVVATVVALTLSAFAFSQQQAAERQAAVAQSLNLATGAQLALNEGDTDLALVLALHANQIPDPPPQAQLILSQAAYAPSARLVLTGHTGAVESVAFAPVDGPPGAALSGSADGSLILWDLETGDAIRRFTGHTDAVHSVAFLPTSFSPENDTSATQKWRAISASGDGSLIVWDLDSGDIVQRLTGHTAAVWDVAVLPDGQHVLSASADGTLRLWDLATGQTVRQFVGHQGAVYCVDISADGRRALSGSADHSLIWWDLATGDVIHHLAGQSSTYTHPDTVLYTPQLVGHQGPVWDVAISPAGRIAMSVSEDQYAILWDLETGELVREYQILKSGLFSARFMPNGRLAVLGTLDGRVALLLPYYGQIEREFLGHQGRVLALDVSPDGQSILSGSADGSLRLWDLSNGAELRQLYFPDSGASLALSPDGQLGLVAHWAGDINLWDYTTGQEIRRLVGHTEMPYAGVKFGPDGRIAISGSGDIFGVAQDKTLRVWDVETGQELHRFEGYADILWDIDISPDGRWAVSVSRDGAVQLWDIPASLATGVSQGRALISLAPQAARSVAFSPDGRSVLVGPGKGASAVPNYNLRLIDVETGADLAPPGAFAGHTETVQAVAFSPAPPGGGTGGRLALSSGLDKLVILWDVASGREIRRFVGHTAEVTEVAFGPGCDPAQADPAGRCVVLSAGGDGVVILWDMESGEALRRYQGHQGNILGAVFTPGGHTILSAAIDSTVREWRMDLDYDDLLVWIAANRYVPELTCQQRAQYHVEPLCE